MKQKILINQKGNITINEGYNKFIGYKSAMNLSDDTIKNYNLNYKFFKDFIGENTLCSEINEDVVLEYIRHLKETRKNITVTSINTYLRNLKVIINYFIERGYTENFKIKFLKDEEKIKSIYDSFELGKLTTKPNLKKCSFAEYRNYAISCYLIGTGNRLNTVRNIKIGDIDFINKEIKLTHVKNKKQQLIPLSTTLENILKEYLTIRQGDKDDYLFCTQFGTQISKYYVKTLVKIFWGSGFQKMRVHLFGRLCLMNLKIEASEIF